MERAGRYFRLNANHTFAKTLEDGKFLVFVDTPQSNDQRSLERAVSNQNVRHRFIANFVVTDQPKSGAILASHSRPRAPSTANATSLGSTRVKQEGDSAQKELTKRNSSYIT
jgi:hypothetical protein